MFEIISMIGLGYIGLPTATIFASRKKKVIGVDINQNVVDIINQGKIHIIEPELDILVHAAVKQGYLKAVTIPEPADVFLIAVPTPFKNGNKPDLSYVESASKSVAVVLKKGDLVILESTSPVGTTEMMAEWLKEARPDLSFPKDKGENADIQIAYCPERVLPGRVVHELVQNDRVIGGLSDKATHMAIELYKIFVKGDLIASDARTAEMCKLAENSFRDVNIAFANELSMICDKLDINVWELISLANRHPRVNILLPGAGVGGHCIAVDPWFIVDRTPNDAKIIRTAREVNDHKSEWIVEKIKAAVKKAMILRQISNLEKIKIAFLGLTFKADIDDLRESPALKIVKELALIGCQLKVAEPNIKEIPETLKNMNILFNPSDNELLNVDILCLLVKHSAFYGLVKKINNIQNNKIQLIDFVGMI